MMQIVHLITAALKPYQGNARTHSKKQVKQIAASMKRFGFTNPVLIDEVGTIMAGHGRVEAAKLLGLEVVPCVTIGNMSEADKRAYILADTKLAQNAGWDQELLAIELQFLVDQVQEIDVTITGFDVSEIDSLIELGSDQSGLDPADEDVPEIGVGDPATELGDVWMLGQHRLVCGDARDAAAYKMLLEKEPQAELAQMVFTDPPYNVRINGHAGGSGSIHHPEFAMASGEMSRAQFTAFLSEVFGQLTNHSVDGSIHYVCMDWRHMAEMQSAGEQHYSELKNLIVWAKDNGGMGSFYRSRHELIYVWKNGTAQHINSFELGQKGRYRTNVWNYRGVNSGGLSAREELRMHPTVKPVAMVVDAMHDCSQRGGIILDPFSGSGTTLIAAQRTGRRARAMEIDPRYCDVSILRWQSFAKDDAILSQTGETFDDVRKRRAEVAPVTPAAIDPLPASASLPSRSKPSPWARPTSA